MTTPSDPRGREQRAASPRSLAGAAFPVPRRADRRRVSEAQWPDDRPSPRATTLARTGLGLMIGAAATFLAWAVSADRALHDRAPLLVSADPSASPPQRVLSAYTTGAAVLGPAGVWAASGIVSADLVDAIDDAVGSCLPRAGLRDGATIRLVSAEPRRQGAGSGTLAALEYRPPGGQPARYYAFTGRDAKGYFDELGLASCSAGWQPPLSQLRRTSRFNPQRMHPILHRPMPHEGTDYGAPKGTPVYAAYRGVVGWAGPHGTHGTWVSIAHPDGVETGYAHLSRIAPGLRSGDVVRAHQLIGYVGSTGRSTGPHLHFSARKDGKFFDAETLLAHASGRVTGADRSAFLGRKAELDRLLDTVPSPAAPPSAPLPPHSETR